MTNDQLKERIQLSILALVAVFFADAVCKLLLRSDDLYGVVKDFSSLFVAAVAAYLAFCFTPRSRFAPLSHRRFPIAKAAMVTSEIAGDAQS